MPRVSELATEAIQSLIDAQRTATKTLITPCANVKGYGAIGDGSTDDTAAIQAAFDTGLPVYFPKATYAMATSITYASTSEIRVIAEPGATIDATSSTAATLITLGGSRGSSSALSADVSKGAVTITTSLSVSAGDILLITSTALFNSTRSYYYKGEMVEAQSVSGTTVTLKGALYDAYTAATTTIHKLNMPKVEVQGLTIRRNSNHAGLKIEYARDVLLANCDVSGARERGLYISYCYGGLVENNRVTDCWYTGTGTSYGIGVSTCQDIAEIGNRVRGGRHAIAHGGWEPCRNITTIGNVLDNRHDSSAKALDFHGNCELFIVEGNTILNGVEISGINFRVSGNRIVTDNSVGVYWYGEIGGEYIRINDNEIESTAAGGDGIYLRATVSNSTVNEVEMARNKIKIATGGGGRGIVARQLTGKTGVVMDRVYLLDNDVVSTSSYACSIYSEDTTYTRINELVIRGGRYQSTAHDSLYVKVANTSGFCKVENISSLTGRLDGFPIQLIDTGDTTIADCIVTGPATNAYSTTLDTRGVLTITGNHLQYMRYQKGYSFGANVTDLIMRNNRYSNITGNLTVPGTARLIDGYDSAGKAISTGTAIPTGGTWAVGDRVYQTTPVAGGYAGWECVTAGTPGTWRPFGAVGGWVSIATAGATPSVLNRAHVKLTQSGATNVTNFTGGYDGQRIKICAGDGNTTLVNGATISMRSGGNVTLSSGQIVELYLNGTVWTQPL